MIAALLKTEKEDYFQSRSSLQLQTNFQEITINNNCSICYSTSQDVLAKWYAPVLTCTFSCRYLGNED